MQMLLRERVIKFGMFANLDVVKRLGIWRMSCSSTTNFRIPRRGNFWIDATEKVKLVDANLRLAITPEIPYSKGLHRCARSEIVTIRL